MNFRIIVLIGLVGSMSFAQDDIKRNMYYGNEAFIGQDYEKAAGYYLDAVDQSPLNFKANYNLANAYYRMNQFPKAIERLSNVVSLAPTSFDKAKAYHNIGNAHMMLQDWEGAIEAYKNALRLNPSDEETRYNLAYALEMKKQQDEQNQDRENQEGGDGENMGDSNDENSGDPQENNGENDESNPNESDEGDQNSDENSGQDEGDNSEKDGEGQSYNAKLSKEQIDNLLKEYYQRERELMKRINENKKGGFGAPRKKDW